MRHLPLSTALALGNALICLLGTAEGGDREELTRVRAANTAAVEAIRTLRCQVVLESNAWRVESVGYWRSGDSIRMHWSEGGTVNQAVIRNGVVKYLTRQDLANNEAMLKNRKGSKDLEDGRYTWHGAIEPHTGGSPFSFDPWFAAMFSMADKGLAGNVTFDQFAENHEKEFRSLRRMTENGLTTIAVEFALPNGICTVHLDPAANFMIRKTEAKSGAQKGYSSSGEVLSFRQAAPGIYFPERVVTKRWHSGKPEPDETATFRNVVINQPIPASSFDLKFKHGIEISNRIEGKRYRVNANGDSISPKTPIPQVMPPPIASGGELQGETKEEPRAWGWWILPASVTLLLIAGTILLIRRRKMSAPE